jgi:dUTP pyrophosphatase
MNLDYALTLMDDLQILITTTSGIPVYAHPGDAGCDLRSSQAGVIEPGERLTVSTGVRIAIPDGFVGLVHSRSGLAAKHGIKVLNSPGTVDAGYRGEIQVTLLNTDKSSPFKIEVGDRIAQMVFQRVERARFIEVDHLPESHRGEQGFGSTGSK